MPAGNYFYLKAGKNLVSFASKKDFGEQEIGQIFTPSSTDTLTLHLFNMRNKKEAIVEDWISDWRTSSDGERAVVRNASQALAVDLRWPTESPSFGGCTSGKP